MSMSFKVYRVAVVGCPRAFISSDGLFRGVGKSCLCNRFVRPKAYVEAHSSCISEDEWLDGHVTNGDHFVYWGAATKHLPDGTKARFQVVEQTEFYKDVGQQLIAHPSEQDYLARASALHFRSQSCGKTAYKYKPAESAPSRIRGPVRNTQLFPNEDFGESKGLGIFGYVCVFDPTLEGKQMESQLSFWSHLMPLLAKRKRKIVVACVKCDTVDEMKIRFGYNVATHALKKAVPFIEVSARENVNVEEAFFALVGPPKKHKSPKNGKQPLSGYLTFKKVLESRKGDINRAKYMYRTLLQKRVTSFSSTWSEIQPTIEKESAYRSVLELAGVDGEETVLKMFQLHLIEIKQKEASKLYNYHSTSKKLDKDSSKSYQGYLSSAFKGHPDLGNESLYDYVYSPRSSVSDISPNDDSHEILTEPSLPSSYRNTPDLRGSFNSMHLAEAVSAALSRPRSSTLQETTTTPLFTSATIPRTPPRSKTPFLEVNSVEPPPLPPRAIDVIAAGPLRDISQSHLYMERVPDAQIEQETEKKRLSNSMDCLLYSDDPEMDERERRYKELVAEPYLHPVEVKEMMSQIQSPLPPATSPSPNTSRNSSIFLSMRVRGKPRPLLTQSTFDNAQGSPILSRSLSFEKRGHKRSRSNPWILEATSSKPPELPPRNTEIPPPVPPRPAPKQMSTSSGGSVFNENVMSPIESTLEFSNRPPLPQTPRKVAVSDRSPLSAKRKAKKEMNFDDDGSTFDEIDQTRYLRENSSKEKADSCDSPSTSLARSPQHMGSYDDDDDDPDDSSNHYARIEDVQKYVQMYSAPPINMARDKAGTVPSTMSKNESESVDYGKKSQTMKAANSTPKREFPSSVSVPTLSWKRKWKKQSSGSINPTSPTLPNTSGMLSGTVPKKSPSHERRIRPLPPSPTKPLGRQFSNSRTPGSNIYEAIDDLFRPRRQGSRKQESTELKWAPPVESKLWPKYVEAVTVFFAIPEIKQQWVETLKSVLPDEDVEKILPPYCNQAPDLGESVINEDSERNGQQKSEEPEDESDQSTPSPKPKLRHNSSMPTTSADDMILIQQPNPISPTYPQSPFRSFPLSVPSSPFQIPLSARSKQATPFESPNLRHLSNSKKASSRDDLIQILNQSLNTNDFSSSDSDSDEEDQMLSSSDEEADSDLEDSIESTPAPANLLPTENGQEKTAAVLQTDLDEALGLRASVSTDSDLVVDQVSDKPPLPYSLKDTNSLTVTGGVEVVHNVKPSQLIRKRGTPKRRNQNYDTSRNLSDSGISNCHSQTYEDGFSALPSHQSQNNSESEC